MAAVAALCLWMYLQQCVRPVARAAPDPRGRRLLPKAANIKKPSPESRPLNKRFREIWLANSGDYLLKYTNWFFFFLILCRSMKSKWTVKSDNAINTSPARRGRGSRQSAPNLHFRINSVKNGINYHWRGGGGWKQFAARAAPSVIAICHFCFQKVFDSFQTTYREHYFYFFLDGIGAALRAELLASLRQHEPPL